MEYLDPASHLRQFAANDRAALPTVPHWSIANYSAIHRQVIGVSARKRAALFALFPSPFGCRPRSSPDHSISFNISALKRRAFCSSDCRGSKRGRSTCHQAPSAEWRPSDSTSSRRRIANHEDPDGTAETRRTRRSGSLRSSRLYGFIPARVPLEGVRKGSVPTIGSIVAILRNESHWIPLPSDRGVSGRYQACSASARAGCGAGCRRRC